MFKNGKTTGTGLIHSILVTKHFFLVAKNIIIMRLLIHFFHIDLNAPCSPFGILPNHCTQEKFETMVMQNFGHKQGVLWTM